MDMMKDPAFRRSLFALGIGALAVACGEGASGPSGGVNAEGHRSIKSSLSRNPSPSPTPAESQALADGNHELTVDLYQATAEAGENAVLSTLSIRTAFAMVYAGARSTTAQEMSEVLHFDPDQARFHDAMNALDLALAGRELPADAQQDLDPVELRQANAFWGQEGVDWREEYLDTLALNYGAGIESLDLQGQSERSRQIINGWVEDRTRDRIQDLLPAGSIRSNTIAVLTNAIYFKAPWSSPFEEAFTTAGDFQLVDGTTARADFMNQLGGYGHAAGEGWTAVEMPFRGDSLSMVVVAPDAGEFESFDGQLSMETLRSALDALTPAMVDLSLPKFEFEAGFTLSDVLIDMGMTETFSGADLSGMVADRSLYVDEAFHKAFIAVNESGAEAAAATAVVVGETSAPVADFTVTVDRPFYFIIRDRPTQTWLFFGRVMDPSS